MNTRAVLLYVLFSYGITPHLSAEAHSASEQEVAPKKSRRALMRAQRKERLAKPNAPAKRFDDRTGRGSVHRTYQHMNYQELEEGKQQLIADGNYDIAIEYGKQQINIATDAEMDHIPDIFLELADLLYAKKDYEKAWKAYSHWAQQYPGAYKKIVVEAEKAHRAISLEVAKGASSVADLVTCTQLEHALFRATDSSNKCTQDSDRDQTQTHETIKLANEFLKHRDRFITHRDTIDKIRTICYEKLITSELNICTFYRLQENTAVVNTRLTLIEEEFGTVFPQSKNLVLAYRATHYPDTVDLEPEQKATLVANMTKPKRLHAADRF